MRTKPKGTKYRNLTARSGVIYYQRRVGGKRIRFSCETNDWEVAAQVARLYEERKGIGRVRHVVVEVPRFADFAHRYLNEDTAHLASTTRKDRSSYLRENGPLVGSLGRRKLDEITPALLREWWTSEIVAHKRSAKTGRAYVDVLSCVLSYAMDLGLLESSPIPEFREQLRRRSRTKEARADADPSGNMRPIESLDSLCRLVAAAQEEAVEDHLRQFVVGGQGAKRVRSLHERSAGFRDYLAILAMLDAGLRVGEVGGLTWGQVRWGRDETDPSRALVIDRARPRGGDESVPKSGRRRTVALSRRLRGALKILYSLQFEPSLTAQVLPGFDPRNFSRRGWARVLRRAEIGDWRPKDLRDTYASWLLSLGVQLGYVSQQLGHSDVSVTARHYARWCGGDGYRDPIPLEPGEVPADLLARVVGERPNVAQRMKLAEGFTHRLQTPGLHRREKPVPSLQEYLAARAQRE